MVIARYGRTVGWGCTVGVEAARWGVDGELYKLQGYDSFERLCRLAELRSALQSPEELHNEWQSLSSYFYHLYIIIVSQSGVYVLYTLSVNGGFRCADRDCALHRWGAAFLYFQVAFAYCFPFFPFSSIAPFLSPISQVFVYSHCIPSTISTVAWYSIKSRCTTASTGCFGRSSSKATLGYG